MRIPVTMVICCALMLLILNGGSGMAAEALESKPEASADPITGDWQQAGGSGLVAQVFPTGEGKYAANLLRAFDVAEEPMAVLEGAREADKITFSGSGWTGAIEGERFRGRKGEEEKFEMRRVTRNSPTLNAPPPKDAIVLFDGTNTDQWVKQNLKNWLSPDGPATGWKILPGGVWEVVPGAGSMMTKQQFTDFKFHLEFRLLGTKTKGNGGIYFLARYQVDIKDTYGRFKGHPCGDLENVTASRPLDYKLNVTAPPLQWQTYDIDFRAPRFDESGRKKIENGRITVVFNGVTLYDNVDFGQLRRAARRYGEAPKGPIVLQEHEMPHQFRNIWIVDKSK